MFTSDISVHLKSTDNVTLFTLDLISYSTVLLLVVLIIINLNDYLDIVICCIRLPLHHSAESFCFDTLAIACCLKPDILWQPFIVDFRKLQPSAEVQSHLVPMESVSLRSYSDAYVSLFCT